MTLIDTVRSNLTETRDQAETLVNTAEKEDRSLTADESGELKKLVDEIRTFEERITELETIEKSVDAFQRQRAKYDPSFLEAPGLMKQGDPFDPPQGHESAVEIRSRALSAVEAWPADDELKQTATETIQRAGVGATSGTADVRGVAGHVLRYSHPLYISAFRKYAQDPESYVADLEPDEREVWAEAREHQRAVLDTIGAVLPSPLDPTIVLTNVGVVDPMRSVARVDTAASLTKRYITSAGSTFSFDAENTEVSDDTLTETEVTITTRKAQGFIQATIEAWMDQPDFSSEMSRIIADGKQRLEGDKFLTGLAASNEPIGIEGKLDGGASEVAPATVEVFASADVYALIEALPPRWRDRATWMAELSTINQIDQFETANGAKLFPRVGEANSVLLRRRLVENSSVDAFSDVDVAASADNFIAYVGDFSQYVILDRVGLAVHFISPGILANTAGNLPDGRVGWYAYWRVGADMLTIDAFRLLNLATTA